MRKSNFVNIEQDGIELYLYKVKAILQRFSPAMLGMGEHLRSLGARDINGSSLWRHCVKENGGETQQFGLYRNYTMLRQISEAVQLEHKETELLIKDIGRSGA